MKPTSTFKITNQNSKITYEVFNTPIGSGGQGNVYKAINKENNQLIGIKFSRSIHPNENEALETLIRNEKQLKHIVKLYDFWISDDEQCILTMELGDGTLDQYLKDNIIEIKNQQLVNKLMYQIVYGVNELHNLNLMHRDLKPQNIIYFKSNNNVILKITDTGSMKDTQATSNTKNFGTPIYMAPEQTDLNSVKYDKSVDIWALGMIWFQMINGNKPIVQGSQFYNFIEYKPQTFIDDEINKLINCDIIVKYILKAMLIKDKKQRTISCQKILEFLEQYKENNNRDKDSQSEAEMKSVVIIGNVGSGKTTLLNKICNSNEKVKSGGKSVTRNLFLKFSSYGKGFTIMDMPGLGSYCDQLAHISAIYSALIERPLNRIFIVVEFDRLARMRLDLKQMFTMLERYKTSIVVVVTNYDKSRNPQEDEEKIQSLLLQPLGIQDYILSGLNTTGAELCLKIDNILENSQKSHIKITDTEILSQFDFLYSEFFTFQLKKSTLELLREFNQICKETILFIDQIDGSQEDSPEIMHALILAIKDYANQMIENFQNTKGETFDLILKKFNSLELAYLFPMHLKKSLLDDINQVIIQAQMKMQQYPMHIYNHIKQCNHCGLIWMKVSGDNIKGCSNTICGAFPNADDAQFQPKQAKYLVKLSQDGGVQIIKRPQVDMGAKKYSDQQKNLKGCGKPLNWDELGPLPQSVLNELEQIGFLDFLNLQKDYKISNEGKKILEVIHKESKKHIEQINIDLSNLTKIQQQ